MGSRDVEDPRALSPRSTPSEPKEAPMNRKLMALLVSGLFIAGTATTATAHHRDGHTANEYGLCTAWTNNGGNSNGKAFEELADTDNDGDVDDDDTPLDEFCAAVLDAGPGQGGGSQNGQGKGNGGR